MAACSATGLGEIPGGRGDEMTIDDAWEILSDAVSDVPDYLKALGIIREKHVLMQNETERLRLRLRELEQERFLRNREPKEVTLNAMSL